MSISASAPPPSLALPAPRPWQRVAGLVPDVGGGVLAPQRAAAPGLVVFRGADVAAATEQDLALQTEERIKIYPSRLASTEVIGTYTYVSSRSCMMMKEEDKQLRVIRNTWVSS